MATYTGNVQITNSKDWLKVFKEEKTLKRIEKLFNIHYKRNAQNLNFELSYIDILKNNNNVIHADTGKWDDTMGIRPKQIERFIKKIGLKYLIYTLDKVQSDFNNLEYQEKEEYREYSEDHNCSFYDFNEFWKDQKFSIQKIEKHKKDRKESIKKEQLEAIEREKKEKERQIKESFNKTLKSVVYAYDVYETLDQDVKNSIFDEYKLNQSLNIDKIFEDKKSEWLTIHGFTPKVSEMLIVDPKNWIKDDFLKSLDILHGTKQLSKIEDKKTFIELYLTFGNNLHEIPFHLLNSKENKFFVNNLIKNENGKNKGFSKIVNNMKKGIVPDISLTELAILNFILSTNSKLSESFNKKEYITQKDLNDLINIGDHFDKVKSSGNIHLLPYLMNQSKDTLDNLFKLNYNKILSFFNNTKDNEQEIPQVKIEVNDYTFEIITKDDIRGYICGYPFSCQYIGGVGERFARYGTKEKNSSFVVVSKKGSIIAQSWVWTLDNQLTFDSIEMKSDVNKNTLTEGYELLAKNILENMTEIDLITVGNNRGTFTNESKKFKKLEGTEAEHCYDSETQYFVAKREN